MNAIPLPGSPETSDVAEAGLLHAPALAGDVQTREAPANVGSSGLEVSASIVEPLELGNLEVVTLEVSAVQASSALELAELGLRAEQAVHRPGAEISPPGPRDQPDDAGTRGRRHYARVVLLAADVATLALALLCGQIARHLLTGRGSLHAALASTIYVPIFVAILNCYGMYERSRRRLVASSFPDLGRLAHAVFAASLVLLFAAGGFHRWLGAPPIDRVGATLVGLFALAGIPLGRAVSRVLVRRPDRYGSRVVIVGSGAVADSIAQRLARLDAVVVVGRVNDGGPGDGLRHRIPALGDLDQLPAIVVEQDVDHMVVAFESGDDAKVSAVLRTFAGKLQISVVPRLFDILNVRSQVEDIAGITVVDVAQASLGLADRLTKRAMDVMVSATMLALASPVLVVVAVAVKLTSPGPVLFQQPRTGRGNNSFMIYKFRTMRIGAEAEREALLAKNEVDGPLFKIHQDPRITRVGGLLRQTSLDELPQLINVLKGDMSLVGPRPFVTKESAGIEGWAARRFDVRPGMTGLWQISGRNDLPFEELCRLDYAYVTSWSLWWDVRILWHTPGTVFHRHGAY